MNEIEHKLEELWSLLQNIPQECKGDENSKNRHRFLRIRTAIHGLIDEKRNCYEIH